MAFYLARKGFDVTGIDSSSHSVHRARVDAKRKRLKGTFVARRADATKLPFQDGAFDAVISFHSLHHMDRPIAALREMFRVCRPGGKVLIADLNSTGCKIYEHKHDAGSLLDSVEREVRAFSASVKTTDTRLDRLFVCKRGVAMKKAKPHPNYPAEAGRYIRGNDASPVAVAIVLNRDEDKIPADLEALVRAGAESGAALSGTVQTPNIGFEKMICNLVGNPNIRYLILGGPESAGHHTGSALKALFANGVDERKCIVGTDAAHAVLHNLPAEFILRLLQQVTLIDLQFEGNPDVIRKAVWACYQEQAVAFGPHLLMDPGPFDGPTMDGRITWRVTMPWSEPENDGERAALERAKALMEKLKARKAGKP